MTERRWDSLDHNFKISNQVKISDIKKSLEILMSFPYDNRDELGMKLKRFNNAIRTNIVAENDARLVRNPKNWVDLLRFITKSGHMPSPGLKFKKGSKYKYIHFVVEESKKIGYLYYDTRRELHTRRIHSAERILDHLNLDRINIIANKIGNNARNEVDRINSQRGNLFTLNYFDTISNYI